MSVSEVSPDFDIFEAEKKKLKIISSSKNKVSQISTQTFFDLSNFLSHSSKRLTSVVATQWINFDAMVKAVLTKNRWLHHILDGITGPGNRPVVF